MSHIIYSLQTPICYLPRGFTAAPHCPGPALRPGARLHWTPHRLGPPGGFLMDGFGWEHLHQKPSSPGMGQLWKNAAEG